MITDRATAHKSSRLSVPTSSRLSQASSVTMSNTNVNAHTKSNVKKNAPFSPSSRGSAMLKAALDHKSSTTSTFPASANDDKASAIQHANNQDDQNNNHNGSTILATTQQAEQLSSLKPMADDPSPIIANFHTLNQQYLTKTINLFTGCASNTSTHLMGTKRKPTRSRTGILGNNQASRTNYKTTRARSERVLFTNPLVSKKFEYEPITYPIEQAIRFRSALSKDQNSSSDCSDGEDQDNAEDEDEDEDDILDIILNKSDEEDVKLTSNQPLYSSNSTTTNTTTRRSSLKRPLNTVPDIFSPVVETTHSDSSDLSAQSNTDDGSLFSPPKVAKIAPFYHLPGIIRKISDKTSDDISTNLTEHKKQHSDTATDDSPSKDVPQTPVVTCNTICATVQTARNYNNFIYNIIAGGCHFITSRLSKLIY